MNPAATESSANTALCQRMLIFVFVTIKETKPPQALSPTFLNSSAMASCTAGSRLLARAHCILAADLRAGEGAILVAVLSALCATKTNTMCDSGAGKKSGDERFP